VRCSGSGKTSVGRILAELLGRPFLDVDDDVLEPAWGTSVAARLGQLGDEAFLAEEGTTLLARAPSIQNNVVALTGSNPLHSASLERMSVDGVLVYLDIAPKEILARCARMKVDRVVGQASKGLEAVLDFRRRIYENCYDERVLIEVGESPRQIAEKIVKQLRRRDQESFVSTRGYAGEEGGKAGVDFLDVVAQGLSPDRGLFVPRSLESMRFSLGELARLQGLGYEETALRVMERFPLGQRLHPSELRRLLYEAYSSFNTSEVLPITPLRPRAAKAVQGSSDTDAATSAAPFHPRMFLMEAWHGPTASFKDLSLQLLPRLLRSALEHKQSDASASPPCVGLLVATSGDTGTAALDGFSRVPGSQPVIVLYPSTGVSIVQKAQMQTTPGDNVLVLGVRNTDFDFCQGAVKDIFNDVALNARFRELVPNLLLSSANSMNFGRFVPQVVFAVRAYMRLVEQGEVRRLGDPIDLVVPTGNFGNILGALYAKRVLGLPLRRIVCASNANNVLYDFLTHGTYDRRTRTLAQTLSPSIDILVSSNLERFLHLMLSSSGEQSVGGGEGATTEQVKAWFDSLASDGHFSIGPELTARVRAEVQAGWASEEQCLATIRDTHRRTGVLIDPHTAVAVHVANTLLAANDTASAAERVPVVVASTAHWAKFPNAMCQALGKEVAAADAHSLPTMLASLQSVSPTAYAASMHPQLAALASKKPLHDEHCDASLASVVERITKFLKEFQARQQAAGKA
jgi:threonine synthase